MSLKGCITTVRLDGIPSIPNHWTHKPTAKLWFLWSTHEKWLSRIHLGYFIISPFSGEILPVQIQHPTVISIINAIPCWQDIWLCMAFIRSLNSSRNSKENSEQFSCFVKLLVHSDVNIECLRVRRLGQIGNFACVLHISGIGDTGLCVKDSTNDSFEETAMTMLGSFEVTQNLMCLLQSVIFNFKCFKYLDNMHGRFFFYHQPVYLPLDLKILYLVGRIGVEKFLRASIMNLLLEK